MFTNIELVELLKELKCIKIDAKEKEFINAALVQLNVGNLSTDSVLQIQSIARRHKRRLEELRNAREKAKKSLWKKANGVTEEERAKLVNARMAKEKADKADFGI